MELKAKINKLPIELRTVANKFDITKPSDAVPEFITNRAMGSNSSEDFSIELNENEYFDIAAWAFEKQGKVLPDDVPGVKDYFAKVADFSGIILMKIFSPKYDNGELKPCSLYQNNDKVVPVGIKDRMKINKECADQDTLPTKGAVYAKHYKILEQFDELSEWEQGLFYHYCYENKAANTQVGKS